MCGKIPKHETQASYVSPSGNVMSIPNYTGIVKFPAYKNILT
jgi:hypothetical protein